MAKKQQIQISLSFNAETSRAKASLKDLEQ
jgi:hypothetical protein